MNAAVTDDRSSLDAFGVWLQHAEVVQLGHQLKIGVPRFPSHPPFMYSLTNKHGDGLAMVPGQDPRTEGASDAFAMGAHTGTHQDSLAHVSFDGRLNDGTEFSAPGVQDYATGIHMRHRPENMRPVVAPGILLDFTAYLNVGAIPGDYPITPESMQACAEKFGVSFNRGEVVLIRTGWDTKYGDPSDFLAGAMPGPTIEAAKFLVSKGAIATGSDTMPYEQIPAVLPLEVHVELLNKAGVFIFETLNLKDLAARRAYRFLFASLPLRILGQTGSPVNPVAILPPPARSV